MKQFKLTLMLAGLKHLERLIDESMMIRLDKSSPSRLNKSECLQPLLLCDDVLISSPIFAEYVFFQ